MALACLDSFRNNRLGTAEKNEIDVPRDAAKTLAVLLFQSRTSHHWGTILCEMRLDTIADRVQPRFSRLVIELNSGPHQLYVFNRMQVVPINENQFCSLAVDLVDRIGQMIANQRFTASRDSHYNDGAVQMAIQIGTPNSYLVGQT